MFNYKYKGYATDAFYWKKWRRTFEGGDAFIEAYLKRFTDKESQVDFLARKAMTYCPSFAKEAVIDIRNAIFQRMPEVQRLGSVSYILASQGEGPGVDLNGTSMTQFMGSKVLDELLVVRKVGIWVDSGKGKNRDPYLYIYPVEDILNWDDEVNPTTVILRDYVVDMDAKFGVSKPPKVLYRHAKVVGNTVEVTMYDANEKKQGDPETLEFGRLPFVILTIKESLLKDIANYQIALLNIASSDMNYTLRANFPFYTEQYNVSAEAMQKFMASPAPAAEGDVIETAKGNSVEVGVTSGRRYAMGTERPGFIAPPTEPLIASMAKQDQLKKEIRVLVALSLSNLSPTRSSSDSKQEDEKGLEAGLACVGQELERAERIIASIWAEYQGTKDLTSVFYPTDYSLKSDADRQAEAEKDLVLLGKIPSVTAQRELVKKIITKIFGGRLSATDHLKIMQEIDEAQTLSIDPLQIMKDLEMHLVSTKYASKLRGYPEGESDAAIQDHVDKLERIAEAQAEASASYPENTPGVDTSMSEKEKKESNDGS